MQKLIFTALLAMITVMANAQSVEDAVKALEKKDNGKAKDIIDKITADPANAKNAYAWLVKAQVYNSLAVDDKFKSKVPDAYEQALDAYKKAYEAEPTNKFLTLDLYKTPYIAYQGLQDSATATYNEGKFDTAFQLYKKILNYGSYLSAKGIAYNTSGYMVPKFDTGRIFMAGYTAMRANKNDDAVFYYSKLAEQKINTDADYLIPYEFLVKYYLDKKDEANFKKYAELGRQLFPKEEYFVLSMFDWARETKNFPELFNSYERLIAMQPDSMTNYVSYASEMFNYLYKDSEKKPADYNTVFNKVDSVLQIPLKKGYDLTNTNLILAQLHYNQGLDLATSADSLRAATKPDQVKKRKELVAKAAAEYDKAIPYTMAVAGILEKKADIKLSEKQTMRNMYGMLSDMYKLKSEKAKIDADKAKADEYKAKADEYDKKYEAVKLH